VSKQNLHQYSE